jgi:hypothetical protein
VLSTPESLPASSSIDGLLGGGLLVDSVDMERKAGVVQQAVEQNSEKLEGKSEK